MLAANSLQVSPLPSFIRLTHHQAFLLRLNIYVRSVCDSSQLSLVFASVVFFLFCRLPSLISNLENKAEHLFLRLPLQWSGLDGLQDADSSTPVALGGPALAATIPHSTSQRRGLHFLFKGAGAKGAAEAQGCNTILNIGLFSVPYG